MLFENNKKDENWSGISRNKSKVVAAFQISGHQCVMW